MTDNLPTEAISETAKMVELLGTHVQDLASDEDSPLAKLTKKELAFVEAYAALAGSHGALTRAAQYAGYAPGTWSAKGSQVIRKPHVLSALRYLTEHKAHAGSILAMRTLEELMTTGNDSIRMKAAEKILGFAGVIVKTIHKHEHEILDNRTPEQIRKAISEKAQKLGLPVGEILDITPEPKKRGLKKGSGVVNNPKGRPKKKKLVPGKDRPPHGNSKEAKALKTADDEIDWLNEKVNE